MIKGAVCGALGKMGKEVVGAVNNAQDMELAAQIDIAGEGCFKTIQEAFSHAPFDIVVDFTQPKSIFENAKFCLSNGIKIVIGTTGLSDEEIKILEKLSCDNCAGCLIAPNFSTGAILMMKFAKEAAKYFDNAEIIELHHNQKKDAPSGTAIKTALMMSEEKNSFKMNNCEEKEVIQGSRGGSSYSDIQIHSVRMPGYMASQEVLLGSAGQILSIRHDSVDRKCYMPGVLLAIRHVTEKNDFIYGLDKILT